MLRHTTPYYSTYILHYETILKKHIIRTLSALFYRAYDQLRPLSKNSQTCIQKRNETIYEASRKMAIMKSLIIFQ